jgi:hypothetical protein
VGDNGTLAGQSLAMSAEWGVGIVIVVVVVYRFFEITHLLSTRRTFIAAWYRTF